MWLRNQPCPNCKSRDNLGVWDDGSTWCWGCHRYTPPTKHLDNLKKRLLISKSDNKKELKLPYDSIPTLPKKVLDWLGKYKLSKEQIEKLHPLYSEDKEVLIFPFIDSRGELIAWQGRYFGNKEKYPKYLTYGAKDFLCLFRSKHDNKTVSVVEDVISAVKLSTFNDSLALLGSHLSLKTALRLSRSYENIIIWLDADKYKEAIKQQENISSLFNRVKVIYTDNDPKEYNNEEIRKCLES